MVQTQKRTVSVCSFVNTLVENYFNLVYRKFSLGVFEYSWSRVGNGQYNAVYKFAAMQCICIVRGAPKFGQQIVGPNSKK